MEIRRGTIQGFNGSWSSGIGFLLIKDSQTGEVESIPAENGCTVRALEAAFGNVIGDGHCVDNQGNHIGQEVFWSLDDMGLVLGGFTPVNEANQELIDLYEKNLKEVAQL